MGHKWPRPKGTWFYIAKAFKNHVLISHRSECIDIFHEAGRT